MTDTRFYDNKGPFSVQEIAGLVGATFANDQDLYKASGKISDVSTLKDATPSDLSFFHNPKYLDDLKETKAGCVFTTKDLAPFTPEKTIPLIIPTPYRAYAVTAHHFYPSAECEFSARKDLISSTASLAKGVVVEVGAVIKKGVEIDSGTFIGANTVIGRGVKIGKNCKIGQNVSLSHCLIGDNVTVLPGTRIGQAGFGFFMDEKGHVSVPQLGRVVLEDRVEIGANVTIDRGTLDDTHIGFGSRVDNLVQLGHGVRLGKHCVIVSQVGISGSTTLGDFVVAAGQAGLAGHLNIGSQVQIAAQAGLMKDVDPGQKVAGTPAVPVRQWHRQTVSLARLAQKRKKEA
ncbi:MAG TPA: UDP-3-O-(3-hydroxymyristoyl)glucosamine N-acyltransferase [Holosporales bacterium]|nr:UDP-3-O-(3-hydroxymyristoyl)glucosamine N-acyltransferase [Holosporales bacterium]